jgi:hypothetical protein
MFVEAIRQRMAPTLVTSSKIQRSSVPMKSPERGMHVYVIRPRGERHCVDLISDMLHSIACGTARQRAIPNAIYYAKFDSRRMMQ